MKLNWKKNTHTYQTGHSLFINKIRVGSYEWNACMGKGDTNKEARQYTGHVLLPRMKTADVYGSSPEEVRGRVERIVTAWFREINREEEKVDKEDTDE